jgi:hypothetical protein
MFQAFVGIIDARGLACLFSEGSVPLDWLAHRAACRKKEMAFCFRAVLSEDAATEAREELAHKRLASALDILQGRSVELIPFQVSGNPLPTCGHTD